ncbi:Oidioi.mRNA.OKI2018_I69.chr1.g1405.t1.cds [Oikopleura dioica]|uniref:ATP-dependent NAD(P)H-hydrate dehydratase n=1 Tax=Oikopleura dioica TaxID=34765 RepID=A0ABN7SSU8_OIKDI|nr:Oidioi.mRNA.OKI2018_I69.chr1.g1405.t1.cds [Oikopleura dioica]
MVVPSYDCSEWFSRLHVLIIGPGLGRDPSAISKVARIIEKSRLPMVLDADGIFVLEKNPHILKGKENVILTPNLPEFKRLCELASLSADSKAEELSKALSCTVLLKGEEDSISNSEVSLKCAQTGSPRRCGGQGDVLCGLTGLFLYWALKKNLDQPTVAASWAASYYLKKASKIAFEKKSYGMSAQTIIEELPLLIKQNIPEE